MVQPANLRNRDDLASFGWFDFPFNRRVSVQRQVRAAVMIIVEVIGEDTPEMTLVEDDAMTDPVFIDGRLGDDVAEQGKFGLDSGRAPKRILAGHLSDEVANLGVDPWPPHVARPRLPSPVELPALAMPAHSAECKRHGKQVIYTTLGKPKPNDQLYQVYVQFERFGAAQYSKELSDKVFRGCIRIAQQGYWVGGKPPYALQRLTAATGFVRLPVGSQRRRSAVSLAPYSLPAGGPQTQPRCRRGRPTRRPVDERVSSPLARDHCL